MRFFAELRRRNVYRVATAYVIVGWLVMQVVDVMQPALRLPEWVATLFAVVLLIGFPIAMVLSWVFDVTPEGIVRTEAAVAGDASRLQASRRLDVIIVAGLALVAGLIVWQQLDSKTEPRLSQEPTIAVLPFEDLSQLGDQQYFADGVSEEILNILARQPSLRVTGRTSSFSFRDSDKTLSEIGSTLGVAALLEGSVRKQGDRVRILARLVVADDGTTLWNESYEAELVDIFAVQDRIAEEVLGALAARLEDGGERPARAPTFEIYDRYLRARELIATRRPDAVAEANTLLETVVALEPDYAAPIAQLAMSARLLTRGPGGVGALPIEEALPKAVGYAERALELDPELADAHAVRGLLYMDQKRLLLAETSLRRALEINPAHTNARLWLTLCLTGKLRFRNAAEELEAMFEIDPLFPPVGPNLVGMAFGIGDPELARRVVDKLERIEAPAATTEVAKARYEAGTGNLADAIRRLEDNAEVVRSPSVVAPLTLLQLRIGDTAGAADHDLPFIPIRSALLEGRNDEASAEALRLLERSGDFYVFQTELLRTLADAGRDAELLDYYRTTFASLEAFERSLFWAFDPELPPFWTLAYAMHRSGADDALEPVMMRWRQAIDVGRANGADNYNFDINEAQWYALRGETDTAVEYLGRAAGHARGLLEARMRYDYLNTLLERHPGFEQLMETNLRRINEERAALGIDALVL